MTLRIAAFVLFLSVALPTRGDCGPDLAPAAETDSLGDPLPPFAIARLGTVRWRTSALADPGTHQMRVGFLGKDRFVFANQRYAFGVWDIETGRLAKWVEKPYAGVPAVGADGQTIFFLSDGERQAVFKLCDFATGATIRETRIDAFDIARRQVAYSRDNKYAAICGEDHIEIWDLERGVLSCQSDALPEWSFEFSPNNEMIARSGPSEANLIETKTGKVVHRFDDMNNMDRPRFSPDGRRFAGYVKESLTIWDTGSGKRLGSVPAVGQLHFTPDSKAILAAGPTGVRRFDCETLRLQRYEAKPNSEALTSAVSPDSKRMAVRDIDGIRIFDADTLLEMCRVEGSTAFITALAFSSDSSRLVGASGEALHVRIWDVATGKRLNKSVGHEDAIRTLSVSADGQHLISGGDDRCAQLWRVSDGRQLLCVEGHVPSTMSAALRPDGKILAVGEGRLDRTDFGLAYETSIRLWDVATGRVIKRFPAHLNSVDLLAYSTDGKLLASTGRDARVRFWNGETGDQTLQIRGRDGYFSFAFLPDGKSLIAFEPGEGLVQRSLASGAKLRVIPISSTRSWTDIELLADGKTVAFWDFPIRQSEGRLKLIDIATGNDLKSHPISSKKYDRSEAPPVHAIAGNGSIAATLGADGYAIQLWNVKTGVRFASLEGHTAPITALALSQNASRLYSGSADGTILVWDMVRVNREKASAP